MGWGARQSEAWAARGSLVPTLHHCLNPGKRVKGLVEFLEYVITFSFRPSKTKVVTVIPINYPSARSNTEVQQLVAYFLFDQQNFSFRDWRDFG